MNYLIGDFLIRIKNAYMGGKKEVIFPYSKAVLSIAKILKEEGYIKEVKEKEEDGKKGFIINLVYKEKKPAIEDIKIISKPSVHVYVGKNKIKKIVGAHGLGIVSTSNGMMTAKNAIKKGVGGEVICQIF
ncbi:30S ribosomal protein S8 [Candidatus Parcubacteria bacterium]|nr:MAG: 30S ribosomal protein S8 [Candidatus Parcubacteria bacterium]